MAAFTIFAAMALTAQTALPASAPTSQVVVRLAPGATVDALGPSARPMVPAATAARLGAAAGRSGRRTPDLTRWAVVPAANRAAAGRLAARLRALPAVRSAAVAPGAPPAPAQQCAAIGEVLPLADGTPPPLDGRSPLAGYLGMTSLPAGGDGAGVKVADVEYDWDPSHIELADRNLPQPYRPGFTPAKNISHGTAALSLIGARSDGIGITGLAPRAELIPVGPWVGSVYNPAFAIAAAADQLDPGDVLLIEQQSQAKGPADTGEYGPSVSAAIAAASAKGIVVVLPAGNGGFNLDNDARADTPFTDTAILVGGGEVPVGAGTLAARHASSNYGSRIDVQGPAHAVVTATAAPSYYPYLVGGDADGSRSYTACFNGTSSASAAVAGAIASMQGIARAQRGTPFTPAEVLARIRATGTPQPEGQPNVGPLPRVDRAADLTPPTAPVINLESDTRVGAGEQSLTWSTSEEAGGSGLARVTVYVDAKEAFRSDLAQGTGIIRVAAGTHRVTVRAMDVVGNSSDTIIRLVAVNSPVAAVDAGPPDPPGTGNAGLAGRVLRQSWNAATSTLTLRFRTVSGARVRLGRRAVAAPGGVVRIRVPRAGTRLVVVGARGHRPLRLRIWRVADGPARVKRLT